MPWLLTAHKINDSLSLFFLQCLISSTHTETCTKLWKLHFPGEFDLNSSWSPDCVLAVWYCTFLTHLPSSVLKILCIITEIGKLKQEAYNTGKTDLWAYGFSNHFLYITYVYLGQMPGHRFFFLKTFQRVLLLVTNQSLKITWHSLNYQSKKILTYGEILQQLWDYNITTISLCVHLLYVAQGFSRGNKAPNTVSNTHSWIPSPVLCIT